jgi:hypothetical protein
MKCLETRRRKDGMKWRRYRTEDGRTITTVELPTAVLSVVSRKQIAAQIEAWKRGETQRIRIARMRALIAQGVKPTAIAHELGVTEQAVRAQRKRMALHA